MADTSIRIDTASRTLLTSEGVRFHTLFSRRLVRWQDITDIDTRSRVRPNAT